MDRHISSKFHKYVGKIVTIEMQWGQTFTGTLEYDGERGRYKLEQPYCFYPGERGYFMDGTFLFRKSHAKRVVIGKADKR